MTRSVSTGGHMRRFGFTTIAAAALAVAAIVAASVSAGTAAKAPIKVGISLPLTGDFSEPGTAALRGYQIWQQIVNANGGPLRRNERRVGQDDRSGPTTTVS